MPQRACQSSCCNRCQIKLDINKSSPPHHDKRSMFSFFSLANSKNVFLINFEILYYLNNLTKYMPWLWHWMLSQLLLLEGGPLNPMMVIGQSLMSTRLLLLQNYLTREKSCLLKTNKGALTAGNKINGYNSRAALAKDMLVILLGKNLEI